MAKKVVCIDPGHGGSDPGACGNGLRECDVSLIVSKKVRDYLHAAGHVVGITRERDVDVAFPNASASRELQARCDVSNNFEADVFVSIHCNAFDCDQVLGTETFFCAGSVRGEELAGCIQAQLIGSMGTVDRGIKSNPLYVTEHTDAVAALVELAFISNAADAAKLADPHWQDEFARAVARGVTDYFLKEA